MMTKMGIALVMTVALIVLLAILVGAGGGFAKRGTPARFTPAPDMKPGTLIDSQTGHLCWGGPPAANPYRAPGKNQFSFIDPATIPNCER